MRLIYETDVLSPVQTLTVNGLNGDSDIEYYIVSRLRNQSGSLINYLIRPNGDATSNYGGGRLFYNGAWTNDILVANGLPVGTEFPNNTVSLSNSFLYAKSGYNRKMNTQSLSGVSGTSMYAIGTFYSSWNDSGSNITSLTFFATAANGNGAGSHKYGRGDSMTKSYSFNPSILEVVTSIHRRFMRVYRSYIAIVTALSD